LLVAASYTMELFRYAESAVLVTQIVAALGIVGLIVRFLVIPGMSKAPDESVALYVEEHEPTLDGALVTAVEMRGAQNAQVSSTLVAKLTKLALGRVGAVSNGRTVEADALRWNALAFIGVTAAAVIIGVLGPTAMR